MSRPGLLILLLAGLARADVDADAGVRPAPPLQVNTRTVPDKAKIGEPFAVEVVVTHDKTQRYELKPPADLGDFDYVETLRGRTDGADSSTTTFHVKLAAFRLGKQKTPALTFEVASPQGTVDLPVAGPEIEIVSSLPADAQKKGENLFDVRPPEEVPVRTWRLLYAIGIGLVVMALGYALVRWLGRPKGEVIVPVKAREPLHVRATKALDALAKENLPGQGRVKEFYFRLSEILRGYLGELYDFEALECTTPELLEALRTRPTPGLPMPDVTSFANQSDFVRYAKAMVTADECKAALELGYRVVHLTTVMPSPRASGPRPSSPRPPAAPPPEKPNGPERLP